jgi:PTS system nitrogen regulatory IIA component
MEKRTHSDEIMTLTEIAGYLKVSEKTVLRMVQSGQFPGVKVSNQWRFVRAVVDDWLSARMYAAPKKDLLGVISTAPHVIPITRLVSRKRIILTVTPGDKAHILKQIVVPLEKDGLIKDAQDYVSRLLKREALVSTAIGHGLAIPHVREPNDSSVTSPCIVLAVCREGTDFGALDGRKTFVFAMPFSGSETVHLRLLAKISLLFRKRGVLKQMAEAQTKKMIMEILATTDQDLLNLEH